MPVRHSLTARINPVHADYRGVWPHLDELIGAKPR